jgi:hypothetical protein
MKYIVILLVVLILASCETYSTRDLERDNPYPFMIRAVVDDANRRILFEDRNARMICDKLPSYDDCVPCEEQYDYSYKECVRDGYNGRYYTADSCMCKGYYHIISHNGLEIILKDPKKARTPSTFITQVDAEIRYMNKSLDGKVMTTKAEIGTTIKQSNNSEVRLLDSYFLDIAGGFEASDGVVSISGGIFYSQKP